MNLFSHLKSYKAMFPWLVALPTLQCPQCTFQVTELCKQVKIGSLLHCTTFSDFNWMCFSILENCHFLFNLMTLPYCVFVLVISTPLKLIRHLALISFAPQPAPAAPQPQLPSRVWPTYVIQVYQNPMRSDDPQSSSNVLTGALYQWRHFSSPAVLPSYCTVFVTRY